MIPRIAGLDLSRDDLQKQINLILDDIEIQLTTDGVDIGAVPRTIAGSDDVTLTGLGNPDVLTWDSATEKWINQTAAEAGLQTTLTFGRGLMKPASDVYVKESEIDHDILDNTHNLTTDIDHDALTNFVANEHTDHTGVTLTAGNGLTGGGDISSNRTFAVGAGTGITVNADSVETDDANIDHDALSNYAVNEHIDWTTASASKATRSTSQSIPNATDTTVVFTTEEYDYQSEYDTGNGRFTADADGVYSVKAAVQFVSNAWVAGEVITLRLYKNTSVDEILDKWKCQANVTYAMSVQGSTDIELTAGDYIRVAVYQSSGGALNTLADALANRFCVHKIR